jgi:hypothetical protein
MAYKNYAVTCAGASDLDVKIVNTIGTVNSCSGIYNLIDADLNIDAAYRVWKNSSNGFFIKTCVTGAVAIAVAEKESESDPTSYIVKNYDTKTNTATISTIIASNYKKAEPTQSWVIYKETAAATIEATTSDGTKIYTRIEDGDIVDSKFAIDPWSSASNDAIDIAINSNDRLAYAWRAADNEVLYTKTDIPVEGVTSLYNRSTVADGYSISGATISKYTAPERTIVAYTSTYDDPSLAIWVSQDPSDISTLVYAMRELQLIKAPVGKEVATVVTEIYNPTKIVANVTLTRYNPNGDEAFSYSIGIQPTEVLAIDHKYLIPEGYSMTVKSSVAGVRICVNAIESTVIL